MTDTKIFSGWRCRFAIAAMAATLAACSGGGGGSTPSSGGTGASPATGTTTTPTTTTTTTTTPTTTTTTTTPTSASQLVMAGAQPPDASTAWPVDGAPMISFSSPIDASTVTNSSVVLTQGTTPVAGVSTAAGTAILFDPTASLAANKPYTLTVTTDVADTSGHHLPAAVSVSFTTGSAANGTGGATGLLPTGGSSSGGTAPVSQFSLLLTSPANNAVNTPISEHPTLAFSEPVDATSASADITLTGPNSVAVPASIAVAGSMVTVTPNAALANSTTYTLTASPALASSTGVALGTAQSISFQTAAPPGRYVGKAFVMDALSQIEVTDTNTLNHLATITGLDAFNMLAYDAGQIGFKLNAAADKLYYVNALGGVTVVDLVNNVKLATIPACLTAAPDLILSPAGDKVFVSCSSTATVKVISTATNAVIASVPVGLAPGTLAINPAGTELWVTDLVLNDLYVVNTTTGAIVSTLNNIAPQPAPTFNPAGTLVYVQSTAANTISVVNAATHTVASSVTTSGPVTGALALDPTGTILYTVVNGVLNLVNTVTNLLSDVLSLILPAPHAAMPINGSGSTGFLQSALSTAIPVYDMATMTQTGTIAVNGGAVAMTITK